MKKSIWKEICNFIQCSNWWCSWWCFWIFSHPFSKFQEGDKALKKAKNGLDELAQKLYVIASVIFTLINVKGESGSMQQQPCNFFYEHISDSSWTSCRNMMSSINTIVECYYMDFSVSSMKHMCYLLPTMEIYFQTATSVGFEVIFENPSEVPECLQPHVSYVLA